jgi:predicted nucleotidyltransferase
LITFLQRAKRCGFLRVYLFGSFISAKDDPGDVDLLWIHRQNLNYDLLSRQCHELVDYPLMRAREGWDMFCCSDDPFVISNLMDGWRKDKAPGRQPRGVILLDLREL